MFNTGIGQHILKNPLIVNGVIEKVRPSGTENMALLGSGNVYTLTQFVILAVNISNYS